MADVPILTADEVVNFIAGIDICTLSGLRNRAVIGLMAGTGCSPAAVVRLVLGDVLHQQGQTWVRLHERDGELDLRPCPPGPRAWLQAYLDRAELRDPDALLFRAGGMRADVLSRRPMKQRELFSMIHDRAEAARVRARLPWPAFRAGGLSKHLANGVWVEASPSSLSTP